MYCELENCRRDSVCTLLLTTMRKTSYGITLVGVAFVLILVRFKASLNEMPSNELYLEHILIHPYRLVSLAARTPDARNGLTKNRLVVKTPEIFNTQITTRYGLGKLCETVVTTIPNSSDGSDNGKYVRKSCRRFPLRQQDRCETENSGFCAAWTSAGYSVELGIGFSALAVVAILFGLTTGSRRRRIWRAVAGLVALQGALYSPHVLPRRF